jgi:hypothetical protein
VSRHTKALYVVLGCMSAIAIAELGAGCTDGVTPNCSNPAECAPSIFSGDASLDGSLDGSLGAETSVNTSDGGDAGPGDASDAG